MPGTVAELGRVAPISERLTRSVGAKEEMKRLNPKWKTFNCRLLISCVWLMTAKRFFWMLSRGKARLEAVPNGAFVSPLSQNERPESLDFAPKNGQSQQARYCVCAKGATPLKTHLRLVALVGAQPGCPTRGIRNCPP